VNSFILRFISRGSLPKTMMSDNASTYSAVTDELHELLNPPPSSKLWNIMPLLGSLFLRCYGGLWEKLIGITKQALKKTLGRSFFTLPMLVTIVIEVEGTLNDRLLT